MPLEPFQIRDVTSPDIPAIRAIYAAEVLTGVATFEEVPPTETEMTARIDKISKAGLPYIVAERDGEVLGYAYAGPFHTRAAYRSTLENTVYIRPDFHRQGIGRALLAELIARAEAGGYRQMMALITYLPDSASVALHSALGFCTMGIAKSVGFKHGSWLDVAYMQRALGAADTTPPTVPQTNATIPGSPNG
jgi:L-amino acid N-acyltransferase YncA